MKRSIINKIINVLPDLHTHIMKLPDDGHSGDISRSIYPDRHKNSHESVYTWPRTLKPKPDSSLTMVTMCGSRIRSPWLPGILVSFSRLIYTFLNQPSNVSQSEKKICKLKVSEQIDWHKKKAVYLNKKNTLNSVCDFSMAYVSFTINKKKKKVLLK